MKRFIYLLNAIFLLLFTKSFIFANDLESKVNYLLELSKNNVSQASSLMSMLSLLTAFFGLVFISIVVYIIIRLIELAKQIKVNKEVLQTIEKHGETLTILAKDTEEIRNQIRDQNLMARGIEEEDYGNFLKEALKLEPVPSNINMIRNLVWTLFKPDKYKSGLERLRNIFSDSGIPTLTGKIKIIYFRTFKETIPQHKLLTWVYEIKENKKELDDLIKQEIETKIMIERGMREFWKNLPPVYPERKLSHLEQIFKDLSDFSKKKKSGE